MEETQNNQSTQSAVPPTPEPVTSQPNATAQPVATYPTEPAPKKGGKTLLIIFVIVLVLITAFMVFFMMNNSKSTTTTPQPIVETPTQEPSATPTATGSAEEQEVEEVDVTDTAPTDFPPLEQDVQGL